MARLLLGFSLFVLLRCTSVQELTGETTPELTMPGLCFKDLFKTTHSIYSIEVKWGISEFIDHSFTAVKHNQQLVGLVCLTYALKKSSRAALTPGLQCNRPGCSTLTSASSWAQELLRWAATPTEVLAWAWNHPCSAFWDTAGHRQELGCWNRLRSAGFALCGYWVQRFAGSNGNSPLQRCVLCEAARCVKVPIRTMLEMRQRGFKQCFILHVQAVAVRKMGNQSEDGGTASFTSIYVPTIIN